MKTDFREKMKRYKDGTAAERELREIEAELEKFQILTEEFLGDDLHLEDMQTGGTQTQASMDESRAEVAKIKRTMKRRTWMTIITAVVIMCVIIFGGEWIKGQMNSLWLDPNEQTYGEFYSDFAVTMHVLSELYTPGVRVEFVHVENTGVGEYRLQLQQWDYFDWESRYTFGKMERGEIQMDANVLPLSSMNIFYLGDIANSSEELGQKQAELAEEYGDMADYIKLEAAISFNKDASMEELQEFMGRYDLFTYWVGVRAGDPEEQILPLVGFDPTGSGVIYEKMDVLYPGFHIDNWTAEDFSGHFLALLRYAVDNKEIMWQMVYSPDLEEILAYVEEHGVKTYGVYASVSPEELIELAGDELVHSVYVKDIGI